LKAILKRHLTFSDILLIAANLVPAWGVWLMGWDAKQIFLVYCLETIIIGLYNILQMWLITLVKKEDEWSNGGSSTMVSGYFFMLFFLIHYGFFVFIQTTIFLNMSGIPSLRMGPLSIIEFITHPTKYLSGYAQWLLVFFIAAYGLGILKDFVINGAYREISLNEQMFTPYGRIIIQQFVVILGSFFIMFGGGKVFIIIFVIVKILVEFFINFKKMIEDAVKKKSLKQ